MLRLIGLVAVLVVLISGCNGSNASPASKAFGGLSNADITTIQGLSANFRAYRLDMSGLSQALKAGNISRSQSRLDSANAILARVSDRTLDIDNSSLRSTMQKYIDTYDKLDGAYNRWLAYFENQSAPEDQGLEDRLLKDIQAATAAARSADQSLLDRILAKASPRQRARIRSALRKAEGATGS